MKPRRRNAPIDQREIERAVYRLAPAGTQEVADLVGLSRQATARRLRALDLREEIWSKKVGPTKVWMHPDVMADPDPGRDTDGALADPQVYGHTTGLQARPF